jgi:hypothetical protein
MTNIRFKVDYSCRKSTGPTSLRICRHEEGVIGYGIMKPVLFQQFLDNEVPRADLAAISDLSSEGTVETFLQSLLDCAWQAGLRPQLGWMENAPSYALAEVSPLMEIAARELRAQPVS